MLKDTSPASGGSHLTRRQVIKGVAGVLAGGGGLAAAPQLESTESAVERVITKGRIRQSVGRWCFKSIPLHTLARTAAGMGLKSIELVPPEDWSVLREHGLICAMTPSHSLFDGLNRIENHPKCTDQIKEAIDATADAGFPNVVTLSGFRDGLPDDVGAENTVIGLKKVVGYAEKRKVNLCLEMINSRVDAEMKGRPDFMCDTVEWAVEVCEQIASERMKILFDIYHVQVMQGDLITRIGQYQEYIAHYHTGGVPGRNEIDDTQEINYPAVIRAIAETGYEGYVGHEFIPTRDPIRSLREAARICDV